MACESDIPQSANIAAYRQQNMKIATITRFCSPTLSLAKWLKRLQGSASSLLYFSDHGWKKNPQLNSLYMHGSRNPSKEAYQVPQFIWYSQQALNAQKRAVGWVT